MNPQLAASQASQSSRAVHAGELESVGLTQDIVSRKLDEAVAGHIARNAALVSNLASKHEDLNVERSVDLHFWAKDQLSASALAASLHAFGATHVIQQSPVAPENLWNVEGKYQTTVNRLVAKEVVEKLVKLAAKHNATFDGWGTSLQRQPNSG